LGKKKKKKAQVFHFLKKCRARPAVALDPCNKSNRRRANLADAKNTALRLAVLKKEISPQRLAEMTAQVRCV
jgi:hypothetical protein